MKASRIVKILNFCNAAQKPSYNGIARRSLKVGIARQQSLLHDP